MRFKETELEKNLRSINKLYAKSDDAISLVNSTIDNLTSVNVEIEKKQEEINTLVNVYETALIDMTDSYHRNVALINNFGKLLEV